MAATTIRSVAALVAAGGGQALASDGRTMDFWKRTIVETKPEGASETIPVKAPPRIPKSNFKTSSLVLSFVHACTGFSWLALRLAIPSAGHWDSGLRLSSLRCRSPSHFALPLHAHATRSRAPHTSPTSLPLPFKSRSEAAGSRKDRYPDSLALFSLAHTLAMSTRFVKPQDATKESWACRTHESQLHQVYLSFASPADRSVAVHLYHTFYRHGLQCFANGLCVPLGTNWDTFFFMTLNKAEIIVLLVSEDTLAGLADAHTRPDPLLTEYQVALERARSGEAVVVPVFLGKKVRDASGSTSGYLPFDRNRCPQLPDAPSAHPAVQSTLSVREIVNKVLELKGTSIIDIEDIILAFKEKFPQNLTSPVLELPWGVVPRVETESGAASGLPLPGLFVSSVPTSAPGSHRASIEPVSIADDLSPIQDIKSLSVETVIKDFCAETTITQTYTCERNAHAMYLFPIDDMATLVDFSVRLGGELLKGRVVEQLDTTARYEEVVAHGSAASILENLQADVYAIQIGEVSERTQVEVTVVYNTLLPMDGQNLCYLLPMALAPRPITVEGDEAARAEVGQTDIDRTVNVRRESQKNNLRIEVRCRMSNTVKEIRCTSHEKANIQRAHQRAPTVELIHDLPYLDKDFVLLIATENAHEPRAMVEINEQGESSSCAAIAYNPPLPKNPPKSSAAEVVFVIQHGPSMARQAQQTVQVFEKMLNLLPDLCENILFNVGCFGNDSRLLWKSSQPYCPESVQKALQFIENNVPAPPAPDTSKIYSSEELLAPQASHRALLSLLRTVSLEQPTAGSAPTRQFLLLSNGNIRDRHGYLAKDIADAVQGSRVFTVGLGYAIGRKLLSSIAKETGAAFFSILPHTQGISAIKTSLFNAVSAPSHVQVLWEFPDSDPVPAEESDISKQVPFRPRPIFYGQPSVIYNLPVSGSKPVKNVILIASKTPGGPEEETVLHGWPQHGSQGLLLQRLAAQTLIHEMEEGESFLQQLGSPSDEEVKQAILDLALKYHLHSPYTTWEVVSSGNKAPRGPAQKDGGRGGSNPALGPPVKTVSKLKLFAQEDVSERQRQPEKPTTVDQDRPSFAPPPPQPQPQPPKERRQSLADVERLREVHVREQEQRRQEREVAERERRERDEAEQERREREEAERKLQLQQFSENERKLQEALAREAEILKRAREAEEESLRVQRQSEERKRQDLERKTLEAREEAEQLELQRYNTEQAEALRRLEEERLVAEQSLAAARERRARDLAQRRDEEAAEQKRRDEERERALKALIETRRKQEEDETAALERAFRQQEEKVKRSTASRADDALRATEEQLLQETRRRAAEREKERLRNEEEAARLRKSAEALRNSSSLRSSTFIETRTSTVGLSPLMPSVPSVLVREHPEFRDALIDWKLDSNRAHTQRQLRNEFDVHEQQLSRKIHDFDEETRRLRRELLAETPSIRDVSEYRFKASTVSNNINTNLRSVHTSNVSTTSNVLTNIHLAAQEEAARLEAERLLAATRNSVDEAKKWSMRKEKNTVSYETLYCPECEREATMSRHQEHRATKVVSEKSRSSIRLQKRTIRYEIDLVGWQGQQFMSPVGPPGWRHFPIFVHKTESSSRFGLYGPAWLQVTQTHVALLTQREGDVLWQVPLEAIRRFGRQGRSVLCDVKDNQHGLGGIYEFESPRFETIVDFLKSLLV